MSKYKKKVYYDQHDYDPDCVICNPCRLCEEEKNKLSRKTAHTQIDCTPSYPPPPICQPYECVKVKQCGRCYKQAQLSTYQRYSKRLSNLRYQVQKNEVQAQRVMNRLYDKNHQIRNKVVDTLTNYEHQMRNIMESCVYHRPRPWRYCYY